jgi:hypothetical protein
MLSKNTMKQLLISQIGENSSVISEPLEPELPKNDTLKPKRRRSKKEHKRKPAETPQFQGNITFY